ncbi:MAG: hypothetical protein HY347_03860 [candidate division NC10 bacterium]|nr:hypothetical protein [candidate division NC10 bacterium]
MWSKTFASLLLFPVLLLGVVSMPASGQISPEVHGASTLSIEVVKMSKRALQADELPSGTVRGVRWDYTLQFKDVAGVGVEILRLTMKVLVDSKPLTSTERWFPLRVDVSGRAEAHFSASISTSLPDQPGELKGVHELLLEGRNGRDEEVTLTIRVPLE